MNPRETNAFMEKIRTGLGRVKAILMHDYSWGAITSGPSNMPMALAVAWRHRMPLTALLCTALFAIASQLWLLPLTRSMQAQLQLRPVQWAQLQHLIKVNQVSPPAGLSASTMSVSSAHSILVTPLDDSEIQKVRAVLAARDIKTNLLRLSNDNPPRLEFQANEVLFSSWIEALNELRQVWRLYPETVSVIASATPGVVQVRSTLMQSTAPQSGLPKAP
jgi:hypothetical protein